MLEPEARHVAPSDDPFTARMRYHQSWYRKHVLGLPPGPNKAARGELYGSILRAEDGLAGWNFATPAIHAFAEARLGDDPTHIEANRLRTNLLSSQPMCFNLFAPLALDGELAARLLRTLPGLEHISQSTSVLLEYAPPKKASLNDGTSFDAWVEYRLEDGSHGFAGIETKLTEPFSQAHYEFAPRYSAWRGHPAWWWKDGAEEHFSNKRHNQLWRNHLLSFALLQSEEPKYFQALSVVLHHGMDTACHETFEAYAKHLTPEGRSTLIEWTVDDLVSRWLQVAQNRDEVSWLQALRLRYLDLDASEDGWAAR